MRCGKSTLFDVFQEYLRLEGVADFWSITGLHGRRGIGMS
jgi:hypothetical protein